MARQGCRNRSPLTAWVTLGIALLGGIALLEGITPQLCEGDTVEAVQGMESIDSIPADYRLVLTWTSASPRIWAGEVRVTNEKNLYPSSGTLSEVGNLTPGPLMTGGMGVSPSADTIQFSPSPGTTYLRDRQGKFVSRQTTNGGICFRVRANVKDRVVLAIRRDDSSELTTPIAIPLAELTQGRTIVNQYSDSASWSLKRVDGDRLRVSLLDQNEAASGLFWDDQSASIHVQCDDVDAHSLELVCDTFSGDDRVVATQNWPLNLSQGRGIVADAKWKPPTGDGAYQLRWRLQRGTTRDSTKGNVWGVPLTAAMKDSLTKPMAIIRGTNESSTIAESTMPIVVLSRTPSPTTPSSWKIPLAAVGRIEPFGRSWSTNRYNPVHYATQWVGYTHKPSVPKRTPFADNFVAEIPTGGYWDHTLPVSKVGTRHRVTITLPDAVAMRMGICILDQVDGGSKPSILRDVTCVRSRLKTSATPWATAVVDFYPQSGSPQLFLVNRDAEQSAKFEAIDIACELPSDAPELATTSPDPSRRDVMLQLDATQWMETYGDLRSPPPAREPTRGGGSSRGNAFVAAQRLIETVKRNGYRGVMMTVFEDGQSLYRSRAIFPDRGKISGEPLDGNNDPQTLEMLLRWFDRESLAFVPCIRANTPVTTLEQLLADDTQASRGIQPSNPWNGFDLPLGDVESLPTTIYNPLHPAVQACCVSLVKELAECTANHVCVRSVGILADDGSCFRLPHRRSVMDNTTLDQFHLSLPTGEIARSQVIGYINDSGSEVFDQWRGEQLRTLYRQCLATVKASQRSLLVTTTRDQVPGELVALVDDNFNLARLHRRSTLQSLMARCRDETTSTLSILGGDSASEATVRAAIWLEPDTPIWSTQGDQAILRFCGLHPETVLTSQPLLDASLSSLSLLKVMSRGDRDTVFLSGNGASMGSATLRRSVQTFQTLPKGVMSEVASEDNAAKLVRLRRLVHEGTTYVVATNHSLWPVVIDVSLKTNKPVEQVGDIEPMNTSRPEFEYRDGRLRMTLQPCELTAFRIADANVNIGSWKVNLFNGSIQLAEISSTVRELAALVAANTEQHVAGCLENASFEADPIALPNQPLSPPSESASLANVNLPGWMLAQHPVDCVTLDEEFASDGRRSIRLSNRDGRSGGTWIVSRMFDEPTSGRIAMSLTLRGEPSESPEKEQPIRVRVAIEGNVAGTSMRQSIVVDVPRDGKWSAIPFRVEVASLPRCGVDSLRLAIDVMNQGTVWIDNIKAEDSFLTTAEKTQLQSQMFLALGGIAKGDMAQAARLLDSHWVEELLCVASPNERPNVTAEIKSLDTIAPSGDKGRAGQTTPGIADRIKAWLPKPLRF